MLEKPQVGDPAEISPELVLVSDEDAAQKAREDLPPAKAPAGSGRIDPPPYPRVHIEDTPAEERPARRRQRGRGRGGGRRAGVVVAVAVLVAAVAGIAWLVWGRSSGDSQPNRASPEPTAGAFVPARTWVWGASKGARAYVFEMTLDGHVVAHATTEKSRYELPKTFRFRPGAYRWTVRRIPPLAGKALLSDSNFVLTKETAARANG